MGKTFQLRLEAYEEAATGYFFSLRVSLQLLLLLRLFRCQWVVAKDSVHLADFNGFQKAVMLFLQLDALLLHYARALNGRFLLVRSRQGCFIDPDKAAAYVIFPLAQVALCRLRLSHF